ncbi:MAG: hypothetical protein ABF264_05895 [Flavobacteriales bacterium]
MKSTLIVITCLALFNCQIEENKSCVTESLQQKLESFKNELSDSFNIEKKQLKITDKLILQSTVKSNVLINEIEFSPEELKSVKKCLCNNQSNFSDTNVINMASNNLVNYNITNLVKLSAQTDLNEHLKLFWLYHLIDKNHISNSISVINNLEFIMDGDTLTDFSEIGRRITIKRKKLTQRQIERSTIAIKSKRNIDMETIDKIENELREIDALRINYSTYK